MSERERGSGIEGDAAPAAQPGECPACYARLVYGEKHLYGCPNAPGPSPEELVRREWRSFNRRVEEDLADGYW